MTSTSLYVVITIVVGVVVIIIIDDATMCGGKAGRWSVVLRRCYAGTLERIPLIKMLVVSQCERGRACNSIRTRERLVSSCLGRLAESSSFMDPCRLERESRVSRASSMCIWEAGGSDLSLCTWELRLGSSHRGGGTGNGVGESRRK